LPQRCIALLLALALPLFAAAAEPRARATFDTQRAELRAFATEVAPRVGLSSKQILELLGKARPQPAIIEAMSRPAERTLAWWEYRDRLLTDKRIDEGVAFWREHRAELEKIAAERGVAPEYLVAILGVETHYGRLTGRYRVIDALATLSFDYPQRAEYFRKEFEQFLLLAHEGHLDPLTATGSYAGAMGAPQFMPSSFRRFAIDEAGKGRPDLWRNWSDVFASVANYFIGNGWRTGEPVLADSTGSNAADDPGAFKLELKDTVATLKSRGYQFDTALAADAPAVLVPAELQEGNAWRVGFSNFYVITRYNRSTRYAMAVHDLAAAVATRINDVAAATP
jgi:membrane-bound lytic murein transglycosylase B